MKKGLVLTVILILSAMLIGCAGMDTNVKERYGVTERQLMTVCDDTYGCRKQFVEDRREIITDFPQQSHISFNGKIGGTRVGVQSWSGYNPNPFGYGGYGGYRQGIPMTQDGRPVPVWLWR